MKNKNGYTIVELIIVIIVVGIIAFVAINNASYAFSNNTEALEELQNQEEKIIEIAAKRYAIEHMNIFDDNKTTFIRVADLVDNGYLSVDEEGNIVGDNNIKSSLKIELSLKGDKINAKVEL